MKSKKIFEKYNDTHEIFIGGDWNARLRVTGDKKSNKFGDEVEKWLLGNSNLNIRFPKAPTRTVSGATIDYFITN